MGRQGSAFGCAHLRRNGVEKPFGACVDKAEPMQDANEQAVTWPERQGQYAVITRSNNTVSMNESCISLCRTIGTCSINVFGLAR